MWRIPAKFIERGIADGLELNEQLRKETKGHGKPNTCKQVIRTNLQPRDACVDKDKATQSLLDHATGEGKEGRRCLKQSRRISQIISRLRRKAAGYPQPTKPPDMHPHARPRTTLTHDQLLDVHNQLD